MREKAYFFLARKCDFYEAFDEYRGSLGTYFQDVCKGGGAIELMTQILGWVCIRYKACNSNLKQGKSKEAILWHLRNLEK